MNPLITAIEAHTTASLAAATTLALLTAVNSAVLAAALAGNFTVTVDTTGKEVNDVTFVSNSLIGVGFTTQINLTTLAINW